MIRSRLARIFENYRKAENGREDVPLSLGRLRFHSQSFAVNRKTDFSAGEGSVWCWASRIRLDAVEFSVFPHKLNKLLLESCSDPLTIVKTGTKAHCERSKRIRPAPRSALYLSKSSRSIWCNY